MTIAHPIARYGCAPTHARTHAPREREPCSGAHGGAASQLRLDQLRAPRFRWGGPAGSDNPMDARPRWYGAATGPALGRVPACGSRPQNRSRSAHRRSGGSDHPAGARAWAAGGKPGRARGLQLANPRGSPPLHAACAISNDTYQGDDQHSENLKDQVPLGKLLKYPWEPCHVVIPRLRRIPRQPA